MPATTSLRDETRRLLKDRPRHRTIKDIAQECSVPERWLKAFSLGIPETSDVNRVQSVYEHLSGRKLI